MHEDWPGHMYRIIYWLAGNFRPFRIKYSGPGDSQRFKNDLCLERVAIMQWKQATSLDTVDFP